jgi:hypothetical protein
MAHRRVVNIASSLLRKAEESGVGGANRSAIDLGKMECALAFLDGDGETPLESFQVAVVGQF